MSCSQPLTFPRPEAIIGPTDEAFARVQDVLSEMDETVVDEGTLILWVIVVQYTKDQFLIQSLLYNVLVLGRHIITNETISSSFFNGVDNCVEFFTLGGRRVSIRYDSASGMTSVNGIPVVEFDVFGNYGVLLGLDGVLGIDAKYLACNPYSEFELLSSIYSNQTMQAAIDADVNSPSALSKLKVASKYRSVYVNLKPSD